MNSELRLPEPNEFIPTDLTIQCPEGHTTPYVISSFYNCQNDTLITWPIFPRNSPQLVLRTPNIRLWHKLDSKFRVPRGSIYISLHSPVMNSSPTASVSTSFLAELIEDDLNEYSYYATLCGLNCGISAHPTRITVRYEWFWIDEMFNYSKSIMSHFSWKSSPVFCNYYKLMFLGLQQRLQPKNGPLIAESVGKVERILDTRGQIYPHQRTGAL